VRFDVPKTSVKSAARSAIRENRRVKTRDSFQNFQLGLGIGTNNASSGNSYGYNPITRNRTELEWMFRGTWLGGAAVDVIAEDMTREGVDIIGQLDPDEVSAIEEEATDLNVWETISDTIEWSRLYGGGIAVILLDGVDYSKPLDVEKVGPGQFRGLLVLDRWQVSPSLDNLVTTIGPELGHPKFYTVDGGAPALRGLRIHHSRCLRLVGDKLPYWQAVTENLWGASVLERPFPIISQYDAATAGISQLAQKSYLRYFKIQDYRKIVGGAAGTPAYKGLIEQVKNMRLFGSNEGITLIDYQDDMVTTQASAFSGIAEVLLQLAMQVSGSLQIPLVRLLGQSPGGLNSSGDSEFKTYNDGIRRRQKKIKVFVTLVYRCIARSLGIEVGDGFGIEFRPLSQMDETQKTDIAAKATDTVMSVHGSGLISDRTALTELQRISKKTDMWKSINDEEIDAANYEVAPKGEEVDDPPPPLPEVADKPESKNDETPNQ
jgi:uncharacterized protein